MSKREDVVIVGAGVIGLACAWYLQAAGREVRVLDRSGVGAGSSHGNCGTLTPSHAPPLAAPGVVLQALRGMLHPDSPLLIRPRPDPALWAWLWRFAARCNRRDWLASARSRAALLNRSKELLAELLQTQSLDCEYAPSGLLYAFRDPATAQRLTREAESLRALDIVAEPWSPARLAEEEPALQEGLAGGLFFPGDACLRPDRYVAELARIVVAAGGRIEGDAEVLQVQEDAHGSELLLEDGRRIAARAVVIATGAWTPRWFARSGLAIPIQPGKGYSITYTRPQQVPRRPLVLKEPSVCVTAWDSGFRLGSTMEFAGYDARLPRARLDALVRGARAFLKVPEGPQRVEEWFGWRPMTWDDVPLIGPVGNSRSQFLACGHGMLGVSMSTATGLLVSELVAGRAPSIDPRPFDPARFQR